jgi:hypothetical protein
MLFLRSALAKSQVESALMRAVRFPARFTGIQKSYSSRTFASPKVRNANRTDLIEGKRAYRRASGTSNGGLKADAYSLDE